MRRIVTAIMVAVFAGMSIASAQQRFSWGPKIGMNVASMSESTDGDPKIGLAAGVFMEYDIDDKFAMSVDVLYSRQGLSFDRAIAFKYNTDYINVPVLVNFYVIKNLSLKAGVQLGFIIAATMPYDGGSDDITMQFQTMDVAIPIGISYDLGPVVFDARYNLGVTNAFSDNDTKSQNHVFQISVGYRF